MNSRTLLSTLFLVVLISRFALSADRGASRNENYYNNLLNN